MDAFGTTINRSADGGTTYTAIGKVTNVSPPGISRETYDDTAHDSADGWREFVGGLVDAGEVSFDINYRPAMHDTLVDDFDAADPLDWQVVFPDTTEWSFSAVLTGFEPSAPFDGLLTASVTLKVSGKPTITPAV